MRLVLTTIAAGAIALSGCGGDDPAPTSAAPTAAAPTAPADTEPTNTEPSNSRSADADATHPDVVDATATMADDGTWRFDVTLSSPYDSPDRYADAWRILAPDGTELGVRILTHHHATEQPFTRSLTGVAIPDHIRQVTIEGRDLVNGWGGTTLDLTLER